MKCISVTNILGRYFDIYLRISYFLFVQQFGSFCFIQFKNAATKHCLEVLDPNFGQKINLYQCDFKSANQLLTFQNNGQILHAAETCLDVDDLEKPKLAVKLVKCHTEDGFRWELHQKVIFKCFSHICTKIDCYRNCFSANQKIQHKLLHDCYR